MVENRKEVEKLEAGEMMMMMISTKHFVGEASESINCKSKMTKLS